MRTRQQGLWKLHVMLILALGMTHCCEGSQFTSFGYFGFGDTSGLTINGSSATASTTDGDVMRLTPASASLAGSVFTTDASAIETFSTVFSFRISNPGGSVFDNNDENGADGLVFLIQNEGNTALGGGGSGIGYLGITPSVAVEFDTWGNDASASDPSQSHVGVTYNGSVNHSGLGQGPTINVGDVPNGTVDIPGAELDDGDRWWAWVEYDGSQFEVFLTQSEDASPPTMPVAPILSFADDLTAALGGSNAYVGFTSGTGAAWADHDLLYWQYTGTSTMIPEPSAVCLLIMPAALAGMRARVSRPLRQSAGWR